MSPRLFSAVQARAARLDAMAPCWVMPSGARGISLRFLQVLIMHRAPTDRSLLLLASLLVAATTFVVLSPSLNNDFIGWDDNIYILDSRLISPLSFGLVVKIFSSIFFYSYTPLTLLSHALLVTAFGFDPRGHHLANLLLHAGNAALVFLLTSWLLSRRGAFRGLRQEAPVRSIPRPAVYAGGIGAALFFAFSPIRLESVLVASSLKDVLSACLAMVSVLCYLRHAEWREKTPAGLFLLLAFIFFVLGILAKNAVVTLPGILILLDLLREGGGLHHLSWRRVLEKLPFALATGVILVVGFVATARDPGDGSWVTVKTDAQSLLLQGMFNLGFYVVKSVWPGATILVYVTRSGAEILAVAAVGVLVSIACVVLWRRAMRGPAYGWVAYLILVLPLAYFIPTTVQPTAARYAYLATVPFAIVFGSGAAWWMARATRREHAIVAACIVLSVPAVFAFLSFRQIPWWKDGETIWRRTIAENPPHSFLFKQMAIVKSEKGEHDSARVYYEIALSLDTNSADIRCKLAAAQLALGDTAAAKVLLADRRVEHAEGALRYITLGTLRMAQERKAEALAAFERAAALNPFSFQAQYDAGYVLSLMGRYPEAMAALDRALGLNPNFPEAHFLKGVLLEKNLGDPAAGREEYRVAARLGYVRAQMRLMELGQFW